jgi:hypothetical protein
VIQASSKIFSIMGKSPLMVIFRWGFQNFMRGINGKRMEYDQEMCVDFPLSKFFDNG